MGSFPLAAPDALGTPHGVHIGERGSAVPAVDLATGISRRYPVAKPLGRGNALRCPKATNPDCRLDPGMWAFVHLTYTRDVKDPLLNCKTLDN